MRQNRLLVPMPATNCQEILVPGNLFERSQVAMDGGNFGFGRRFSLVRLEAGIFPVRHGRFKCFALFIHARQHGALEDFQAPFAGVTGQQRAFDLAGSALDRKSVV